MQEGVEQRRLLHRVRSAAEAQQQARKQLRVGAYPHRRPQGRASMFADLDLLLIAVFCAADDLLPKKPGNARPIVTDAEVVTLCVAQSMMGIPSDPGSSPLPVSASDTRSPRCQTGRVSTSAARRCWTRSRR